MHRTACLLSLHYVHLGLLLQVPDDRSLWLDLANFEVSQADLFSRLGYCFSQVSPGPWRQGYRRELWRFNPPWPGDNSPVACR